jgi:hypothetical protein
MRDRVVSVLKLLDLGTTSVRPEILRAWKEMLLYTGNEIGKENLSTVLKLHNKDSLRMANIKRQTVMQDHTKY